MPASDLILSQIMSDFADLAQLVQRAMDAEAEGGAATEALQELRDLAFQGAARARDAIRDRLR